MAIPKTEIRIFHFILNFFKMKYFANIKIVAIDAKDIDAGDNFNIVDQGRKSRNSGKTASSSAVSNVNKYISKAPAIIIVFPINCAAVIAKILIIAKNKDFWAILFFNNIPFLLLISTLLPYILFEKIQSYSHL